MSWLNKWKTYMICTENLIGFLFKIFSQRFALTFIVTSFCYIISLYIIAEYWSVLKNWRFALSNVVLSLNWDMMTSLWRLCDVFSIVYEDDAYCNNLADFDAFAFGVFCVSFVYMTLLIQFSKTETREKMDGTRWYGAAPQYDDCPISTPAINQELSLCLQTNGPPPSP